jgi:3-dehydroquinate synthase
MIFALKISKEVTGLSFNTEEFITWVKGLGYQTEIPAHLTVERLLSKMKQDKKSAGGSVRFVLLNQIGKPNLQELSDDFLLDQLKNF